MPANSSASSPEKIASRSSSVAAAATEASSAEDVAAFLGILRFAGLNPALLPVLQILLALFIGFEGPALVRWTVDRKRYRCVDVVSALTREEAEHQFLRRWAGKSSDLRAATPVAAYSTIGLFSDEAG